MKIIAFVTSENESNDQLKNISDRLEDNGFSLDFVNVETREGVDKSQVYDILQTPSIVVTTDDGSVVRSWTGELPTTSDVINNIVI
jgi:transketolase C-terminal domain/subunit